MSESDWLAHILVVAITVSVVASCVLIHYEALSWLSHRLSRPSVHRRRKVLYAIFGVLTTHVLEIWLFGFAYWLSLLHASAGSVAGLEGNGLLDLVYLSAVTFTTVGFGDIVPQGAIRFVAGTEALTGFVLITWSASFTYLEMDRYWRAGH